MTTYSLETLIRAIELDSQHIASTAGERQRNMEQILPIVRQVEDMLIDQERERFLNEERQRLETAETLYAFHQENLVKEQEELENTKKKLAEAIWNKAVDDNEDPIDLLIQEGYKNLAIAFYHDEYVLWTKQQPDYEQEICSICIEPCTDDESYTECGHLFHKKCISKWNKNNGCPNCRSH